MYKNNLLFLLSLFVLLCTACTKSEQNTQEKQTQNIEPAHKKITLIMGGDALLHAPVYNDAKYRIIDSKKPAFGYDFTKMFLHIKPIIAEYDLAFYNQETILGGKELGLSSYPAFNSPQEFGDCMIMLGFNLISLANNHTLDRGERAIRNSLSYWRDKPVLTAGSYTSFEERNQAQIHEKNGITYTLLAYTYGTNGIPLPKGKEYLVNVYTKEMLANDIAKVRDKVDVLMVSMHWGNEYVMQPSLEQEEFARYLASLGVDIVIGNHPHVIQPIEWIGNTLVIYALGNMISAQKGLERRVGMFAGITITKDSKTNAIRLHDLHTRLLYTYYDSHTKNFQIYPFSALNDTILPNYKKIHDDYMQIITQRDINKTIRIVRHF